MNELTYRRYALDKNGLPHVETSLFYREGSHEVAVGDPRCVEIPGYGAGWFLFALIGSFVDYEAKEIHEPGEPFWLGGFSKEKIRKDLTLVSEEEFLSYVDSYETARRLKKDQEAQQHLQAKESALQKLEALGLGPEEAKALFGSN